MPVSFPSFFPFITDMLGLLMSASSSDELDELPTYNMSNVHPWILGRDLCEEANWRGRSITRQPAVWKLPPQSLLFDLCLTGIHLEYSSLFGACCFCTTSSRFYFLSPPFLIPATFLPLHSNSWLANNSTLCGFLRATCYDPLGYSLAVKWTARPTAGKGGGGQEARMKKGLGDDEMGGKETDEREDWVWR